MKRLALLALVAACTVPDEPRPSTIAQPTVIAVAIDPPEAKPGQAVTATVTVATPDGAGDASAAAWALCIGPRPLTDNNTVARRCLADTESVLALGNGATITATLSRDACALFGPDPPPGGQRPRDPDPTGGYYQPLRVELDGTIAFGMARLLCHLANAPLSAAQRYDADYTPNRAPVIDALTVPGPVHPGDAVTLAVRWPAGTRERFLRYDVARQTIGIALEQLSVSWYATAGEVDADRSFGDDAGAQVGWTAPATAGTVHLWAVVRDDRGGVAVRALDVDVSP